MRALRSLGPWLAVLVLVPVGALAYLGVRGAEGQAERLRQRVRDELAAAAPRVQAEAQALVEADAREAQATVERLSAVVERRLPHERPGRTLRDLRALAAGRGPSSPGRDDEALRWLFEEVHLDLRVLDALGRVRFPATCDPDGDEPAAGDAERLWRDLRAAASAAAFGRGDAQAARAIWADARSRVREPALLVRADVESGLLTSALAATPAAAQACASALREAWGDEALAAVGRPWVLLLLRAAAAGGSARDALQALESALRLDEVPLTSQERLRLFEVTRPVWGHPLGRDTGSDARHAPLPHGLGLELRRRWPGPAHPRVLEALARRLGRVQRDLPALRVEYPVEGRLAEPSPLALAVPVPLVGGTRTTLRLRHADEDLIEAQAAQQRAWTLGGAGGLVALVGVGLLGLRAALARERAARRLQDDFLANVSHELRTPLTGVCLHADLLAEPGLAEPRRRAYAEVVRAEGARLSALVDDLLDFAALERGARRLEVGPVDLGLAVQRAAAPLGVLAEAEGVRLELPPPGAEVAALADPHALARILANLLGNAWKHGRPSRAGGPGRIRVEVSGGAGGAAVSVLDDGPGIPAGERPWLFERFRRGAASSKTRGVGLGLALSRELARAMGGDVALVEDPEATVFRLTLPPAPPGAPEVSA